MTKVLHSFCILNLTHRKPRIYTYIYNRASILGFGALIVVPIHFLFSVHNMYTAFFYHLSFVRSSHVLYTYVLNHTHFYFNSIRVRVCEFFFFFFIYHFSLRSNLLMKKIPESGLTSFCLGHAHFFVCFLRYIVCYNYLNFIIF